MDDKTWAQIAIQLGVINPGLAEEFERTKQELGLTKSLAEVLKENGLVNDGDIESVAALEPVRLGGTPKDDYQRAQFEYAKKCSDAKVINEEQATECLRDLVIEGQSRALRDLLIERRYSTAEQLDALDAPKAPAPARAASKAPAPAEPEADFIELPELTLEAPPPAPVPVAAAKPPEPKAPAPAAPAIPLAPIGTKRKMKCVKCKLTLEVISRGKQATCPRCKIPLEDVGFSPQLRTDATFTTQRLKAADIAAATAKLPSKEAPKPAAATGKTGGRKVVCIICDASIPDEREPGGRVHCPSCGASFAPK